MANLYWLGTGTAGDFDETTNWGGTNPSTADDNLFFIADNTSKDGPSTDMAGFAAVNINSLNIFEGYTKDIGSSSNHADFNSINVVDHRGSGKLWLKAGGGTTDAVVLNGSNNGTIVGALELTGATVTDCACLRGTMTVDSAATVTNLECGSRDRQRSDATLSVGASATVTTVRSWGGSSTIASGGTTLEVYSGTVTVNTAVFTNIHVYGGTVFLNIAGTYAKVVMRGGTIDVTKSGGVKVFTLLLWYGGTIIGEDTQLLSTTTKYDFRHKMAA